MIFSEVLVTVGHIKATGLTICGNCQHSSKLVMLRFILFSLTLGFSAFDCYTHWEVWLTLRASGLGHPLLSVPTHWTRTWLILTCIGTALTSVYIANELSGAIGFYREYRSKRWTDPCLPCIKMGLNFVTRVEIISLFKTSLEDLPLLVLSLIFAAAKYSCNHPTLSEDRNILNIVFFSSMASLLNTGWCFTRFLFRLVMRACNQRKVRAKPRRRGKDNEREIEASSEQMRRKIKEMEVELDRVEPDSRANRWQLYPTKWCKMRCCIIAHSIVLTIVYGFTICISVSAMVLAKHQGLISESFSLDLDQELRVYHTYPQENPLLNVSTIIDGKGNGVCLREVYEKSNKTFLCEIFFLYDAENGQIQFNYDEYTHNASNVSSTVLQATDRCSQFYNELFLGYETSDGVKNFDDTCVGVLILFDNDALLKRQEDLLLNCDTSQPMT